MNDSELSKVNYEKGYTVRKDLETSKHCSDVVETVNKLNGFIGSTFCSPLNIAFSSIQHTI